MVEIRVAVPEMRTLFPVSSVCVLMTRACSAVEEGPQRGDRRERGALDQVYEGGLGSAR